MRYLFTIIVFIVYACPTKGYGKNHGKVCRYWCRAPNHRYYCCPTGKSESLMEYAWHSFLYPWFWMSIEELHGAPVFYSLWPEIFVREKKVKKDCPPLRTHCSRTYDWYSQPTFCHKDDNCKEWEKCCYDVCLEHKTCKHVE